MAVRWQFVEEREPTETWWIWRVLPLDGTIESQSQQRFKSYGAAVGDAIRNGFRPSRDHWIVVTRHTATHFRPGEPHVSVPVAEPEPEGGKPGSVGGAGQESQPATGHPGSPKRTIRQ